MLLFIFVAPNRDLEAVLRALKNNKYGFEVVVSRSNTKETMTALDELQLGLQDGPTAPVPPKHTKQTDLVNRRFCTSSKKLPRPKVQEEESLLRNVNIPDPALALLANDVHSLERQGLYKMPNKNNFNYRNGRSYVK